MSGDDSADLWRAASEWVGFDLSPKLAVATTSHTMGEDGESGTQLCAPADTPAIVLDVFAYDAHGFSLMVEIFPEEFPGSFVNFFDPGDGAVPIRRV